MPERITEETALEHAAATQFAGDLIIAGPDVFALANLLGDRLTVEDVAKHLGLSKNTIYKRINRQLKPIAEGAFGQDAITNRTRTGTSRSI